MDGAARCCSELEHRPVIGSAALVGCAVEIADSIENQACPGNHAICAVVLGIMQHLLRPAPALRRRQLESCSVAVSATERGRAVEIAIGIEDHGIGVLSVASLKSMKYGFRPWALGAGAGAG